MRLLQLDPVFLDAGGIGVTDANGNQVPQRTGVGITFDCPCGCGVRRYVPFANPLDNGPARDQRHGWQRQGDTFDTLTLTPSILVVGDCAWHGFIRNGEIVQA